jgi:hypothetical protein
LIWLATQAMRDELERVHPQRQTPGFYAVSAQDVLKAFDTHAHWLSPSAAPVTRSDADDQKFIDLAAAHQAMPLSKDKAVISMRQLPCTAYAQVAI